MMEGKARLTFLGTGTSQGVPMIGCDCPVCRSTDPRDNRLRASALVEYRGLTILIDAGPDFRYQMLRAGVRHLDAILLTHNHKDHTGGIDDVRSFNLLEAHPINIYCQEYVENSLRKEYSYAFADVLYPGAPEIHVHRIGGGVQDHSGARPFMIHSNACEDRLIWKSGEGYFHEKSSVRREDCPDIEIIPIQGWHHDEKKLSVLGYRFGNIAYLTDIRQIEPGAYELLQDLDYVTVNCVKRAAHHSHFGLEEALAFFDRIGARNSYLTHISHMLPGWSALDAELQAYNPTYHVAYDGLILE